MKKSLFTLAAGLLLGASAVQAQIPTNGLVARYDFDSTLVDVSGNDFDAELIYSSQNLTYDFSTILGPEHGEGYCLFNYFTNGVKVDYSDDPSLFQTENFTYGIWVYNHILSINTDSYLFNNATDNNDRSVFLKINNNNGSVKLHGGFVMPNMSYHVQTGTTFVNEYEDKWMFIAMTSELDANGERTMKIYLNGVEVATTTNSIVPSIPYTNDMNLYIGSNAYGNSVAMSNLKHAMVYDRTLSASEIWDIYDHINLITFPDANFEDRLVNHSDFGYGVVDKNDDGRISYFEAAMVGHESNNFDNLALMDANITDLTGIEHFWYLYVLEAFDNQIESLDLSKNRRLGFIDISNNSLEYLNLASGENENIVVLFIQDNPDLTCVTVDDPAYSEANWIILDYYDYDEQVEWSEDCLAEDEDNDDGDISVDELIADQGIAIYPNPASTTLNIEIEKASKIAIVDILGQVKSYHNIETGVNTIDVDHLVPGVYFIQIENGKTVKFLKQ